MQIIPVIDLMQGKVVHAKHGLRGQYQPIQSQLTDSHAPLKVVDALLKLYPFDTFYIADIDAILGTGANIDCIEQIAETHPTITLMLDMGISQANARALYMGEKIKAVVGSENIENLQDYRAISYACKSQHILSLDYNQLGAMGIPELHETSHYWPDSVICMSLASVGSEGGVDVQRLEQIIAMNLQRKHPSILYAAGGLRDIEDANLLSKLGIKGVLVATALHNLTMPAMDIARLMAM